MSNEQDWDRLLNPFRYKADGSLTDAAKQPSLSTQLSSANGGTGSDGETNQLGVGTTKLNECADALVGLRSGVDNADRKAIQESDAAGGALNNYSGAEGATGHGWETGGALIVMGLRWEDQARHLNELLQSISDRLYESKKTYTDVELAEKARLSALQHVRR